MHKHKVLVILGPTASGKTALSLYLAEKLGGEIISADSRQIYRGMTIGTAKPPRDPIKKPDSNYCAIEQELELEYFTKNIKHHLIDIKNPDEEYSVSEFKANAEAAVYDIASRTMVPIMVGGSAQYLYALVDNWQIPEVKANPALRAEIEKEISEKGLEFVYEKLLALDPEAAYVVDPKNPRRIVRALEVAISTGQPFTAQRQRNEPLFDCLLLGINPEPEELKKRIAERVKTMFAAGLVTEVQNLLAKYPTAHSTDSTNSPQASSGQGIWQDTIGYREIIEHLTGATTLAEAEQKMISNTNHFARRQMQWFKRDQRIKWIENVEEAEKLVQAFLE